MSGLLPDWKIQQRLQLDSDDPNHLTITPFFSYDEILPAGVLSYGLDAYGYDFRLGRKFRVFTNTYCAVVDPKKFDTRAFVEMEGDTLTIPPNSFALAETLEYFEIPRDVLGTIIGKSTIARYGIVLNATPLEPEWTGRITLEFSNTTPLPAILYAGEGCGKVLFHVGEDVCARSYKDKKGKYQGQKGLTLPIVK